MKKLLTILMLSAAISALGQGALTPPGAPTPTMKTLDQLEPRIDVATLSGDSDSKYVISTSGSYYLSENIGVTNANADGVRIDAVNVTLDLNGFEVTRASGTGGYGIYITSGSTNATVRNGTVQGFSYGLCSYNYYATCSFEKLSIANCYSSGINIRYNAQVIDCQIYDNGGDGITGEYNVDVRGCVLKDNGGSGVEVDEGVITDCRAFGNGKDGIHASFGSKISKCVSRSNAGIGIYVADGSTVEHCLVSYNSEAGIHVRDHCSVSGNLCDSNGKLTDREGIYIYGDGNRIDGNMLTNNGKGMRTTTFAAENLIVRNNATGNINGNYGVATGNKTGTIQTSPVGAGAWDNFSY